MISGRQSGLVYIKVMRKFSTFVRSYINRLAKDGEATIFAIMAQIQSSRIIMLSSSLQEPLSPKHRT